MKVWRSEDVRQTGGAFLAAEYHDVSGVPYTQHNRDWQREENESCPFDSINRFAYRAAALLFAVRGCFVMCDPTVSARS